MNAVIYIKLNNSAVTDTLYQLVTIYDQNENVVRSEIMPFTLYWHMDELPQSEGVAYPIHATVLTGIPPGGFVIVSDIALTGTTTDQGGNVYAWTSASAGVHLYNLFDENGEDISDNIGVYESTSNPVILQDKTTRIIKFAKTDSDYSDLYYQTPSDLTFDSEGNYYSGGYGGYEYLDKLLNSINVFSFDDIEGTHIVGPIIAQNSAYYKRDTPLSTVKSLKKLIFSDYSRGIASYIGNLTARADGGRDSASNYKFDRDKTTDFVAPLLYTSTSTWLLNNAGDYWLQEYVVIKDEENVLQNTFISPNNSGQTAINHNDNYFDFETYYSEIMSDCINLFEDGSIENYPMIYKTYDSTVDGSILYVNPGECWDVVNADNLEEIYIILPDGVNYFESASPAPLTINFSCTTINPTVIDGKTVSQFPLVTFNGEEFDSEASGETVEFNEFGNKLIFNMPYIVTDENGNNRVVTVGTSQNIPGHLLMPNAQYWNYQENSNGVLVWEGGNINGLLLASDVHLGETEMHMWAYGGLEEKFTSYKMELMKKVNGLAPSINEVFEFELDYLSGDSTGIYNLSFPMTAKSDGNGDVEFDNLIFVKTGTYEFTIKETIPENSSNYIYDKSEYVLTVVVTEVDKNYEASATLTQTKDSDGNDITGTVIQNVIFNNLNSSPVFPSTGGIGTGIYFIVGLSLIFISLLLFKSINIKNNHKKLLKGMV